MKPDCLVYGDMRETKETPTFARYAIEGTLGSGGMGTVYLAHHEILDRPVALKVPKPELASNEVFVQRFLREARALGTLNHPNIVKVYDAGIEQETPYIAMEYVAGDTLNGRIRQEGQIPLNHVTHWGAQMARALAYLHGQQILHRDLKSANIIINERGDAVVADFGIAQIEPDSNLTRGLLGTPSYMSPEQAMGKPLDIRSDLYSLGIILYECLTGTVPFRDENSYALLQKVIHETPQPIRRVRPDAPDWICQLVSRCISKAPEDRFQDGTALLDAFRSKTEGVRPLYAHYLPAGPVQEASPAVAAHHFSLAVATLARSIRRPERKSLPGTVADYVGHTVTMYSPLTQAEKPAPVEVLPKRHRIATFVKPLSAVLLSLLVIVIAVAPFTRFSPADASNQIPISEKEAEVIPLPTTSAAQNLARKPTIPPKDSPLPDSTLVVNPAVNEQSLDSTAIPSSEENGEEHGFSLLNLKPIPSSPFTDASRDQSFFLENFLEQPAERRDTPSAAERDPQIDKGDDVSDKTAANIATSKNERAGRLPKIIAELASIKQDEKLQEALFALSQKKLILYGDRQSVREPDFAFIFLIDPDTDSTRSLLVPSQEGWIDYLSGNIVTEENGRFYEQAPDEASELKWWLHNVQPTWVELQQPETADKKKKRLGW